MKKIELQEKAFNKYINSKDGGGMLEKVFTASQGDILAEYVYAIIKSFKKQDLIELIEEQEEFEQGVQE